jgi:hypothetical protein
VNAEHETELAAVIAEWPNAERGWPSGITALPLDGYMVLITDDGFTIAATNDGEPSGWMIGTYPIYSDDGTVGEGYAEGFPPLDVPYGELSAALDAHVERIYNPRRK